MSLVGSPFGNCWGTGRPQSKKPAEKREEKPPTEEPQETDRPRHSNCWGSGAPKSKKPAKQKETEETPQEKYYESFNPRRNEPFGNCWG